MDGWRAAADVDGILAFEDLSRSGLSPRVIASMVRSEEVVLLDRGWYAATQPETPEARHVLATKAMLRAHEGRALASHHSGLLFLGLPTYRADLDTVRLTRRTPGAPRTRRGQRLGRAVPVEAQGTHTVVPALAIVQHGISGGPLSALVAADAALRSGVVSREDLARAVGWVEHHPHSALIKGFLALADGRRESPGETRLAHAFHLMRLSVTPQFEVSEPGFTAYADFLIDGEDVVVEFDGRVKYGRGADTVDPFGRRRPADQVLWDEKRREDRIRELGYEVVRVTWADLDDPVALARRIRAAIQRARMRAGRRTA